MQLRSRPTMPTSQDVMLVARRAALTGSSHRAGRAAVDKTRAEASQQRSTEMRNWGNRLIPLNTSLLWARAIDLGSFWIVNRRFLNQRNPGSFQEYS